MNISIIFQYFVQLHHFHVGRGGGGRDEAELVGSDRIVEIFAARCVSRHTVAFFIWNLPGGNTFYAWAQVFFPLRSVALASVLSLTREVGGVGSGLPTL